MYFIMELASHLCTAVFSMFHYKYGFKTVVKVIVKHNNNNNIYLLQLGCHRLAVVMLRVYKT